MQKRVKKALALATETIRAMEPGELKKTGGGGDYTFGAYTMCCDSVRPQACGTLQCPQ